MAREAEQSTIEEIRKEQTVKKEIKEYTTKDKTTEKMVEVKHNYLSVLVMHYLQTTLSTERARKDTL
jgi:RNase adaptor protein for sRNA GlmZ degradation